MMADYKQMYLKLLNATENAMEMLIAAQRQRESYTSKRRNRLTAKRHKDRAAERRPISGCRKKPPAFFRQPEIMSLFFVPPCGTKIVASRREASTLWVLHARLARQGFARHLILFEAGFAPRASPCVKKPLTP